MTMTLYRSGAIHAPGSPRATAALVDVDAGEIVWVGTDEAAVGLGDPDTEVNLDGRLMVPAFVDTWVVDDAPEARRRASAAGVGAVHVVRAPANDGRLSSPVAAGGPGPAVMTYHLVEAGSVGLTALTERYEELTRAGVQSAVVVRDEEGLRRALAAAASAAERLGSARFVAARHRLQVACRVAVDAVPELARLGLVACIAGGGPGGVGPHQGRQPLRAMAFAGVAFAFGSAGDAVDPWSWVRRASGADANAISARAAFAAATRGGHRAARSDGGGLLRPGAPATFGVWEFEGDLVVRSPDARVAAWSTDPRAATPGLPDLEAEQPPLCRHTVVAGVPVFDDGSLA